MALADAPEQPLRATTAIARQRHRYSDGRIYSVTLRRVLVCAAMHTSGDRRAAGAGNAAAFV